VDKYRIPIPISRYSKYRYGIPIRL